MQTANNLPTPIVIERNGLTRLEFNLPSDVVISKNIIRQINGLPFLLPIETIEKMGECGVVYSVGGLISLPKYLRQGKINLGTVVTVLRGICDAVSTVKEKALYTDNLSYSPDHIFINTQTIELKMILFPFETGQQTASAFRLLLSSLTAEIILPDADAVTGLNKLAEYCGRSDFKIASFICMLDELVKNYKPTKRKKEKPTKSGRGFWHKLFHKKDKPPEQTDASSGSDLHALQTETRKRSGTELLLPDDEPDVKAETAEPKGALKTVTKMVRLTISVNGMTSEAEITVFPCVLGRSPHDANVVLQDSSVSRQHAVIDMGESGFVIYDLGSSNGLTLNGAKLASKAKQPIANNDSILIGRVELQVTKIDGV